MVLRNSRPASQNKMLLFHIFCSSSGCSRIIQHEELQATSLNKRENCYLTAESHYSRTRL